MKQWRSLPKLVGLLLTLEAGVLGAALLLPQAILAAPSRPLFPWEFEEAAPQGFGDRQNSGAWSMQWWNGKLYVGTVRSWFCWSQAWFHKLSPLVPYPPSDPDFDCAPDPRNLPLQAEIWCYTPETSTWERIYQSPNDVEIPGNPGWYTARDMGFRDMVVFTEPDGTEALYVGGATVNALWPPMPPPRILRSTDGLTFEPIPQDPGTVLGDLGQNQTSFRDFEIFKGRLYVINGEIQGQGPILEAENPAGGNDNFRWVSPLGMKVFEMAPFNGFLYVGIVGRGTGFTVAKTDATGPLPYTFTPVVTNGGFRQGSRSPSVVSMHVFKNRLYVGTDQPVELIRINPDDTWDLIVGTPRETPDGWKYPLSGLDAGFNWPFTAHLWKMQEHEGVLYMGTNDPTLRLGKAFPKLDEQLKGQYGFDLYATADGYYIIPITVNGFGDKYQVGIRTFASTPYGLFLGTVSFWYSLRIWQGTPGEVHTVYVPLLVKSKGGAVAFSGSGVSHSTLFLEPPRRLEIESKDNTVVLSWEPPAGATRFRVFRSDFIPCQLDGEELNSEPMFAFDGEELYSEPVFGSATPSCPGYWIPGPFIEIGVTDQLYFVDIAPPDQPCQYYVLAQDDTGVVSRPSNLVRVPSLVPIVTFESLNEALASWLTPDKPESQSVAAEINSALEKARNYVQAGDLDNALHHLEQLRQKVKNGQFPTLAPWRAEDLEVLLAKLARRVSLVQAGIIVPSALDKSDYSGITWTDPTSY